MTKDKLKISDSEIDEDGEEIITKYSINNNIIALLNSKDCKHLFKAIKIVTNGHISIALYDVSKNSIELFDSGGSSKNSIHTRKQQTVLNYIFKYVILPSKTKPSIQLVNLQNLQISDNFCQTYIYYYIYQRTLVDEPAHRIVAELQKLTSLERFNLMSKFWFFITHS